MWINIFLFNNICLRQCRNWALPNTDFITKRLEGTVWIQEPKFDFPLLKIILDPILFHPTTFKTGKWEIISKRVFSRISNLVDHLLMIYSNCRLLEIKLYMIQIILLSIHSRSRFRIIQSIQSDIRLKNYKQKKGSSTYLLRIDIHWGKTDYEFLI